MEFLKRLLKALPLLLLSPFLAAVSVLAIAMTDLFWKLFGKTLPAANLLPDCSAASVVIPNWNGRDLLAKYLPSVIAAMSGNPRN